MLCLYNTALIFKIRFRHQFCFFTLYIRNMLTKKNDIYYKETVLYYGAISRFFETHLAKMSKYKSDYACDLIC